MLALDRSSHCSLRMTTGSLRARDRAGRVRTTTVPNGPSSALKLEPMSEMILRELSEASSELAYTDGCVKRGCQPLGDSPRGKVGGRRTTAGYQVDGGVCETLRENEALGDTCQGRTRVDNGNKGSQIPDKEC